MKLIENIIIWFLIGGLIGGLIWLVAFAGLGVNMGWEIPSLIGLISTGVVAVKTSEKTTREVSGNKVSTSVNPLNPQKIGNGDNRTKYEEYGPGVHFTSFLENPGEEVSIAKDIVREPTFTISIQDDDAMPVSVTWSTSVDSSRISIYLGQGDNETERVSNVETGINGIVNFCIECEMKDLYVSDIMSGKGKNRLKKALEDAEKDIIPFCRKMGIKLNDLRIKNTDFSKDISEARRMAGEITIQNAVIQKMIDESEKDANGKPTLTWDKAASHVRIMSDASMGMEWNLNAPSNFSGTIVMPQNFVHQGGEQESQNKSGNNSKSKKNPKNKPKKGGNI